MSIINYKTFKDLVRILLNISKNNIYGSVEVFFENGRITQITQRIISKIRNDNNGDEREEVKKHPYSSLDETLEKMPIDQID